MVGAGLDPLTASDTVVSEYADYYFEYDDQQRVVLETVDAGGESYSFSFTAGTTSTDYNVWANRTTETLPDGSQNIVYTNLIGQYLITASNDGTDDSDVWINAYQYDSSGRQTLHANPSAVIGYDDSFSDLNIEYQTNSGLIELTDYYTTSGGGAVPGYIHSQQIQQGIDVPVR